ncbi:MAG: methyltransferase domain-containing protein [Phycisphaeraceae bacterium]|nr:methyltransferase domain-containing protein [Phycisphaeraceae bacterium]
MGENMQEPTTSRLYDIWAWFYDYSFGALVTSRQRCAVAQLGLKPGDRVLDLGVGTGATLPMYPKGLDLHIVGLDLSHGMLAKAQKRIDDHGLTGIDLVRGDAIHPPFKEASFDHVLICHAITVVSDPARLLAWAAKMVKPGGRIVLCNHFRSSNRFIGWLESITNPIFIRIGWRSDLPLEDALQGAGVRLQYRFKMRMFDLWQIVICTPTNAAESDSARQSGRSETSGEPTSPMPLPLSALAMSRG